MLLESKRNTICIYILWELRIIQAPVVSVGRISCRVVQIAYMLSGRIFMINASRESKRSCYLIKILNESLD